MMLQGTGIELTLWALREGVVADPLKSLDANNKTLESEVS